MYVHFKILYVSKTNEQILAKHMIFSYDVQTFHEILISI